jgi:hypothetical protein
VSQTAAIEIARENAKHSLQEDLLASARISHRAPVLLCDIASRFHTLGIVAMLGDGDPLEYARLLALAGQTDAHCRSLDLSSEPRIRMVSRFLPFADALAAGDLDTARAIARLCPEAHEEGFEYEDDFLRYRFMHLLLTASDNESVLSRLLNRWKEVAEGNPSPHWALSRAILSRDPIAFEAAMADVLAARRENRAKWRKTPNYRVELDATEGSLFVLGLAYLRLADLRDMPTLDEYEGMPSMARVRLGTPPPPGAWCGSDVLDGT